MLALCLIILALLTLVNFWANGSPIHPSVIYSAIWLFQLFGLWLFESRFTEPTSESLILVTVYAILFSVGAFAFSTHVNANPFYAINRNVRPGNSYIIAALAISLFCAAQQYKIFTNLTLDENFATALVFIRTMRVVDNEDIFGIYKYGNTIALSGVLVMQIKTMNDPLRAQNIIHLTAFIFLAIFMAILSTGRGPILLIPLLLGITYIIKRGFNKKALLFSMLFVTTLFLVFWIMGSAMGKTDTEAKSASNSLIEYLFSSIPALSLSLLKDSPNIIGGSLGTDTFRIAFALLSSIGLSPKPDNLVQEFIAVPHLTNLYTIYLQYIRDFGLIGAGYIIFGIGVIHGGIFSAAARKNHSDFNTYIFSISFLPLLQSVFQETYFLSVSIWIQMFILGALLTQKSCRNQNHGTCKNVTSNNYC